MKHANWLVVVTLVLLSGMAAAQLNSSTRAVAKVQFEFMVANKIVPAGECEVQAFTMDGQTLVIRNAGAKMGLFSRSSQAEGKQNASNYAMVFKHYGDR